MDEETVRARAQVIEEMVGSRIRREVAEEIFEAIMRRPDICYAMTAQPDILSRITDADIARRIGIGEA
jgi:hypothetical protein